MKTYRHFCDLTRLYHSSASESGTCLEANAINVDEPIHIPKPPSDAGTSYSNHHDVESTALHELEQSAEADLRAMEKRVAEIQATVSNLKNKILLNSQTIDRLVGYRLLR